MKFKRICSLIMCMVAVIGVGFVSTVAKGHRTHFKVFNVKTSMGGSVKVKVEKDMFAGLNFRCENHEYTEEEWIDFFVRNVLVGRDADTVKTVKLRKSVPHGFSGRRFSCPPVLPSEYRFLACLEESKLIIVCSGILNTVNGKWYLNETGLNLFGKLLR